MGMLAVWSRSVFPGMLFHLIDNSLLLWVSLLPRLGYVGEDVPLQKLFHPVVTGILALLALAFLAILARRMPSTSLDGAATDASILPDGQHSAS